MADATTALWMGNPIFAAGGEALCEHLASRYPAKRVRPGTGLSRTGSMADVSVLLAGSVRVFNRSPEGLEATVKLLRAPCLFGDFEVFHNLPTFSWAAAIDDVTVARIPRADFLVLLDEHPSVTRAYLDHVVAAFSVAARSELQLFAALDRRIANLILSYTEVSPTKNTLGEEPVVALSQEAIAQSLGVVRRSVANVLGAWIKAGILRRRGAQLVIEQPDLLRRLREPIDSSLPYWIGMPMDIRPVVESKEASLEVAAGPAELVGKRLECRDELTIGSDLHCDLVIGIEGTLPRHARLFRSRRGGRHWVQSLSRRTRVSIDGAEIDRRVLHDGDVIELGPCRLVYRSAT